MSEKPSEPAAAPPKPQIEKSSDTGGVLDATGQQPTVPGAGPHSADPRIGEFVVVRKLGEGGMGAVYLAEDVKLRRQVAIKTMRPELAADPANRDRFEREARAAARVEHDHIVPILHIGESADGTPFIVMPFLQGESLDALLKRDSVAPLDLILKIAREVAEGLAAAHAKGLVHRDIKPANIWLEGDISANELARRVRRVKILDFGLARTTDGGEPQITNPGAVMGTPAYMSPEQAKGATADHRADLFSLGATLYRAVTGKLPFDGPTPMSVLIALTTEPHEPVRAVAQHLPPALADLIDRLLNKAPTKRPQSAEEVADAIRAIEADVRTRGAVPTTPVRVVPLASTPALVEISPSEPQMLSLDSDEPTATEPEPEAEREEAPPPRPFPWVIVFMGAALLVIVPLGLWLAGVFTEMKHHPGAGKKEGSPSTDTPTNANPKNDPKKDPKNGPKNDDPTKFVSDRAAAEWVLSLNGVVYVDDKEGDIQTADALPKEPFRLTGVSLSADGRPTDAALSVFKGCEHLTSIDFSSTPIGDSALAHFARCANLKDINLSDTRVSDTGFEEIKRFKKLRALKLEKTKVTAEGAAALAKALPECEIVWTGGTIPPASDADRTAAERVLFFGGKVHVNGEADDINAKDALPKGAFRLTRVFLTEKAKDADLAVFGDCKNVTDLYLAGKDIGTEGLAHFKECKNLKELYLSGTVVDDKSVPTIKSFKKLKVLSVGQTKLTEKGVNDIAKALPGCTIHHDGGTIEPKKK